MDLEFTIDTDHRCVLSSPSCTPPSRHSHCAQKEKTEPDDAELSQLPHVKTKGLLVPDVPCRR